MRSCVRTFTRSCRRLRGDDCSNRALRWNLEGIVCKSRAPRAVDAARLLFHIVPACTCSHWNRAKQVFIGVFKQVMRQRAGLKSNDQSKMSSPRMVYHFSPDVRPRLEEVAYTRVAAPLSYSCGGQIRLDYWGQ